MEIDDVEDNAALPVVPLPASQAESIVPDLQKESTSEISQGADDTMQTDISEEISSNDLETIGSSPSPTTEWETDEMSTEASEDSNLLAKTSESSDDVFKKNESANESNKPKKYVGKFTQMMIQRSWKIFNKPIPHEESSSSSLGVSNLALSEAVEKDPKASLEKDPKASLEKDPQPHLVGTDTKASTESPPKRKTLSPDLPSEESSNMPSKKKRRSLEPEKKSVASTSESSGTAERGPVQGTLKRIRVSTPDVVEDASNTESDTKRKKESD